MNWRDFFASLFASLASLGWPAAVVFGLWLFKERLTDLLPRLRLKRGEWEAYFDDRLDRAEGEAEQLPKTQKDAHFPALERSKGYERLAEISPRAAILDVRSGVEKAFRRFAKAAGVSRYETKPFGVLQKELRQTGFLGNALDKLVTDLRELGNSVAHVEDETSVDKDLALRYGKTAEQAIFALDDFTNRRSDPTSNV